MSVRKILVPVMISLALLAGGCKNSNSAAPASAPQASSAATDVASAPASSASVSANGCPTSNATSFAKTKFVLHGGLAFGAFHRYLYKPFRAGTFTTGTTLRRAFAFGKAGAAALFIKREVRLAIVDVQANPTLCNTLAAPLGTLSDNIAGVVTKLKGGDTTGIEDAQKGVSAIESAASSGGAAITEDANPSIK
ncbi:MAG: hypothetical protein NVSMB55_09770 [Mycobacteriales bacterium]